MSEARRLWFHRKESCLRKKAYATWQEAEKRCLELCASPIYQSHGYPEMAYRCIYGDHWHIGRNSPKGLQKRRQAERLLMVAE